MFLAYHAAGGRTFLDRVLYLPRSWSEDAERCQAAGVPDTVQFATKLMLARQMIELALDHGVPIRWVTGDAVYGSDSRFRRFLQARGLSYVLGVTSGYTVRPYTVGALADTRPRNAGKRRSAGDGSKGPNAVYENDIAFGYGISEMNRLSFGNRQDFVGSMFRIYAALTLFP